MLQQSLTGLLHNLQRNKPGLCHCILVEKEGVASMPNLTTLLTSSVTDEEYDFLIEEITLKEGYQWKELSSDQNITLEFDEQEKKSVQQKAFTYQLSVRIPNDDFNTRGKLIRAYDNREFIMIVTERTGAIRVLGSMERGCDFSAQLKTGTLGKGPNQFTCGFTWEVGMQRAFYTKSFLNGTFWFRVNGTPETALEAIRIDEPVYIDWGDGTTGFYNTPASEIQTINHAYTGDPYSYVVYHKKLATYLNITGTVDVNSGVAEILGTLSPLLIQLELSGNYITTFPSFTAALKTLNCNDNSFDDSSIEGVLETLDILGAHGGTVRFADQTPPVTPTVDMATFAANLEAKGWLIAY